MWFACVIFIAIFGIAECKGVLWASIDAGAKEEPRAARIYQAAGEQVAPPRERLHTCQTGIAPFRGSHLYLITSCIFFSFFSVVWSQCCSSLCLFPSKGSFTTVMRGPALGPGSHPDLSCGSAQNPSPSFFPASTSPEAEYQRKGQASSSPLGVLENSKQEVHDLKEQLEALRCQVGCSLLHSFQKCVCFYWEESRIDVDSLLPGKDCLMLKETSMKRWTAPPSGGSVPRRLS